jgi:hypothetical protein
MLVSNIDAYAVMRQPLYRRNRARTDATAPASTQAHVYPRHSREALLTAKRVKRQSNWLVRRVKHHGLLGERSKMDSRFRGNDGRISAPTRVDGRFLVSTVVSSWLEQPHCVIPARRFSTAKRVKRESIFGLFVRWNPAFS